MKQNTFSIIQNQILKRLLKGDGIRYRDIRPINVENDLFNYHLQFLVNKGYLKKEDNLYFLSDKGKQYVQRMDVKGNLKKYFKVSVLAYVIRVKGRKREILLQKRLRHPYYGDIGTVSGKVNIGESYEKAAERKLEEETGLVAEFRFVGVIRKIRRDKNENIIEDTLYHVCYGKNPKGKLEEKNEYGENFWDSFERALKYQKKNITAGKETEKIMNRVRRNDMSNFYYFEDLVLKKY